MFHAICSRTKGETPITADEAFSKVWRLDDWGSVQIRDGWVCPECRQPVFLKPPHERLSKEYSFVVQAHFCHHSSKAAAQCALYRAGVSRNPNQADAIYSDRKQSLSRFLGATYGAADYIAGLLGGEEEALRGVAKEIGILRLEYSHSALGLEFHRGAAYLTASDIHGRLEGFDSFLAGVFALGLDHNRRVRNGFLAVKGRKNRLRTAIIEFGRNRKHYFREVVERGLGERHIEVVDRLLSQVATEVEAAKQEGLPTHHGMASRIVDKILDKVGLKEEGDWIGNHMQYLLSLPILGNELPGFEQIGLTRKTLPTPSAPKPPHSSKPPVPPNPIQDPPIRITGKGKLLIGSKVLRKLAREGSKLDGLTSFVLPDRDPEVNSYLLVPGDGCLLLTSMLHSDPKEVNGFSCICPDIILADKELPVMLWDQRICLLPVNPSSDILVGKEVLLAILDVARRSFDRDFSVRRGGLKFRRVHSGLRITIL